MDSLNERVEHQKKLQELIKKKALLKEKYHEIKKRQKLLEIDKSTISLKIKEESSNLLPVEAEIESVSFKIQELRSMIEIGKDVYFSNKP